jgi:hypothetical protein
LEVHGYKYLNYIYILLIEPVPDLMSFSWDR